MDVGINVEEGRVGGEAILRSRGVLRELEDVSGRSACRLWGRGGSICSLGSVKLGSRLELCTAVDTFCRLKSSCAMFLCSALLCFVL